MAGITRVNGTTYPAGFYGYTPQFLSISVATSTANLHTNYNTVGSNFEAAVKAIETVGSIVILGTPAAVSSNSIFTVVVDQPSFNSGKGATTAGSYGALKDALASQLGVSASAFTIAELALSANTLA